MAGRPGGGGRATTRAAGAARACAPALRRGRWAPPKPRRRSTESPERCRRGPSVAEECRKLTERPEYCCDCTEERRRAPRVAGEIREQPERAERPRSGDERGQKELSSGRARAHAERSRKVPKRDGAARVARARPPAEAPRRWRVRTGSRDTAAPSLAPSPGCPRPRHRGTPSTAAPAPVRPSHSPRRPRPCCHIHKAPCDFVPATAPSDCLSAPSDAPRDADRLGSPSQPCSWDSAVAVIPTA